MHGLSHVLSKLVDMLRVLERFVGVDEVVAEEAFNKLKPKITDYLSKYLFRMLPRTEDREDAISETLISLWKRRRSFAVSSEGAWWVYVTTTARRKALDVAKGPIHPELEFEIAAEDVEMIDIITSLREEKAKLYSIADELWLGIQRKDKAARRKILAGQLFYLEGQSLKEIVAILGQKGDLTEDTLEAWLADKSVLLGTSYGGLYRSNDELVGYLLQAGKVDSLIQNMRESAPGDAPEGWSWSEVQVVLWHYRNGLSTDKIVQMSASANERKAFSKTWVEGVLKKCQSKLPFVSATEKLIGAFSNCEAHSKPLQETGLWRRLVFQYSVADFLPHKHILERTEAPAKRAGNKVNATVLTGWLSMDRLFTQLTNYAAGDAT